MLLANIKHNDQQVTFEQAVKIAFNLLKIILLLFFID